jgi:hypothetical protein
VNAVGSEERRFCVNSKNELRRHGSPHPARLQQLLKYISDGLQGTEPILAAAKAFISLLDLSR